LTITDEEMVTASVKAFTAAVSNDFKSCVETIFQNELGMDRVPQDSMQIIAGVIKIGVTMSAALASIVDPKATSEEFWAKMSTTYSAELLKNSAEETQ